MAGLSAKVQEQPASGAEVLVIGLTGASPATPV